MKSPSKPILPSEDVPPQLAAFLSTRRDHLTARWIEAVRQHDSLEAAKEVDDQELADHLPKLLDDLVAAMSDAPVVSEAKAHATAHGDHRWHQRYDLEEVLEELGIVSRVLLAHGLDAFADAHPATPKEQLRGARERILRFFEDAVDDSIRQYLTKVNRQMGDLRETDLSLSEQRRLALDSAQLGWWNYDVVSGEVSCDERFRLFYDVEAEADVYALFLSRVHPEDQQKVDQGVKAALRVDDPVPFALDYRVQHRDGTVRWVASRGQVVFVGEGTARRAVRLAGTLADITEDKQAAQALAASEAKYRSLFDSIDTGFCVIEVVWDDQGNATDYRFLEMNPAFVAHTGMHGAVGKTIRQIYPGFEQAFIDRYARVAHTGEAIRFEESSEAMGRWFEVYAFALPHGDQTRVAVLFGDISERRRSELALKAAKNEAERTSQMKDEFLATLSHELRTPLNAILGWTQVLRGDPANSQDMEDGLATIERNSRAQNAIIEDLLDMSRIISGKVRLEVQPLDLDQVIKSAVESMRPAADAKGIRLQALIDPEARMISGDPNRLQQVFWNLLSNAIKFTPKGGKVQVLLERIHSHLEVSVVDSGEGIAAEFLPYVFDRFRQQDASTTRRHGGLGLGLAIVKQLVELHGGGIHVDSSGQGQGTTFRVTLPLWVVRTETEPASEGREHPHARRDTALPIPADRLDLAGVKVLVVDDETDARALVKRLLEDRGVEVRTAGSADQTLELLAAQPPDVLVSDIGMPGEDGYALIRRVRVLPTDQGGKVPAVALTAYARSEDRLKVLLEGFQAHLAKPVEAAELLTLVASLAGRVTNR